MRHNADRVHLDAEPSEVGDHKRHHEATLTVITPNVAPPTRFTSVSPANTWAAPTRPPTTATMALRCRSRVVGNGWGQIRKMLTKKNVISAKDTY
jgi:hypothetical protein